MKVEYYTYKLGGRTLFYIVTEDDISPNVTARCYTVCNGIKHYVLDQLEEGIYSIVLNFNFAGKYIVVFSEDGIKKLIVVVTAEN